MDIRGVSSTFSVILLVTITIILASSFTLISFDLEKPKFIEVKGEKVKSVGEEHTYSGAYSSQIVRIHHISGNVIDVQKLKIAVEVIRDGEVVKRETIWGFPCKPYEIEYSGDDIISRGIQDKRYFGELAKDRFWEAGEFIGFRIKRTGIELKKGDIVKVMIIYGKFTLTNLKLDVL